MTENHGGGITLGEELLPTNRVHIEDNTIEEGAGGVLIVESSSVAVIHNRIRDVLAAGVSMELAHDNLIKANDLRGAKSGVELGESYDNRIEGNNASGTLGSGIEIGELSFRNEVIDNLVHENGGEGIEIADSAPVGQGNWLEGNNADANGGNGISIEGAGHTVKDNSARVNGGWGIYAAIGANDRGGNFAAGNAEFEQCYRVICRTGAVPGEPETWIVDHPANPSGSRNASFTYMGSDNVTPIHELVFECRIDSTNDPNAWEDCEYPAEILNLSPGVHTFEVRAIDLNGAGLADSTPAKFVWAYVPLTAGDPPEAIIDLKPQAETWLTDVMFTFHSNEPDVTFECKVDFWPYEPCGFEAAQHMNRGGFEWGLDETEVGPHTFSVRAIDFEGNVGEPATYTWRLLGVHTNFLPGPHPESTGFTPPETPLDPATGSETLFTTAIIDFEANVADATYLCSLDLDPFLPCTPPVRYEALLPGGHMLRVIGIDANGVEQVEASEYEWEIVDAQDVTPPVVTIERAPSRLIPNSSTLFEFTGTDDFTPPLMLRFECRLDSTNPLDWEECTSPFNLLDLYTYQDPQMAPGPHRFEVRAIDMAEAVFENPGGPNPNFEGNVSEPAVHDVDDDGGHDAAQHGRHAPAARDDRPREPAGS